MGATEKITRKQVSECILDFICRGNGIGHVADYVNLQR